MNCPNGTQCPDAGTGVPTPCPSTTYSGTAATACEACWAGYFCSGQGVRWPVPCDPARTPRRPATRARRAPPGTRPRRPRRRASSAPRARCAPTRARRRRCRATPASTPRRVGDVRGVRRGDVPARAAAELVPGLPRGHVLRVRGHGLDHRVLGGLVQRLGPGGRGRRLRDALRISTGRRAISDGGDDGLDGVFELPGGVHVRLGGVDARAVPRGDHAPRHLRELDALPGVSGRLSCATPDRDPAAVEPRHVRDGRRVRVRRLRRRLLLPARRPGRAAAVRVRDLRAGRERDVLGLPRGEGVSERGWH